jgi:hippurate hydrolase
MQAQDASSSWQASVSLRMILVMTWLSEASAHSAAWPFHKYLFPGVFSMKPRTSLLTLVTLAAAYWACPSGRAGDDALSHELNDLAQETKNLIGKHFGQWFALYKDLHAHPELSSQEQHTSQRLAREIKEMGFDVNSGIGGYGLVAILRNGTGPTVLVRTDMDALPVLERSGLSYASRVQMRDRFGKEVNVMHACGHDMHMTCWIGTARCLAELRNRWHGTLVFIAQPAEETGTGARLMLEAGLFERFPKPDYCLALHCDSFKPFGEVSFTEGLALANVDSVDITVRGKGGHGAAPHTTIDPIVLAARIILDLQTIASRETNPTDPVVVTVGSIHGGTKHNIIPNEVRLQLTVRSTKDSVRKHTLDAIERMAKAAAQGAGAPEPTVKIIAEEFTPALLNEPKLTRRTVELFKQLLGPEKVHERPPLMGGEDFSRYGRAGVPIFMYLLGTISPERMAEAAREGGKPLPSLHSDMYYPVPEPSIKTGVLTMTMAVLNLVTPAPAKSS